MIQQSTIDWINQYQGEMQDMESDDDDELTKLVSMLDEVLEELDHSVCYYEQDVH